MSKLNKSKGNMYSWVTHTWSPVIGCMHQCDYCYVKTYRDLPTIPFINGPFPSLGTGNTIFVGHMCDMFATNVEKTVIDSILKHCNNFTNTYVFQTKNPKRFLDFEFPTNSILGTTIETNRDDLVATFSKAPAPSERGKYIGKLYNHVETFVTIEPILDFDVDEFIQLMLIANPTFINIGADSKRHGLPEPSGEKIISFINSISPYIEIREKVNLTRLVGDSEIVKRYTTPL